MTPAQIRHALAELPSADLVALIHDRHADEVSDETIATLVGIAVRLQWPLAWWRAPDSGRRMSPPVRHVLDDLARGDGRERSVGMPAAYRDPDGPPDPGSKATFALEVEGEQFAVHLGVNPRTGYTDTSYTWLSGPHKGYGFSVGGPPDPSQEEHRQRIREFLAMVDPTTGFIEDD